MAGPRSDNLSRKTASTGVCETSQTEYISQSRDEDGEDENGGKEERSEDKEEEAEEEDEKVAEMAQLNVKMLFLHNEQVLIKYQFISCQTDKLDLRIVRCL